MVLEAEGCKANESYSVFFFFFKAEEGIRDYKVTGVQPCALPIFTHPVGPCGACLCSTPATEGRVKCYQKWISAFRPPALEPIPDGGRGHLNVGPPGLIRVLAGSQGGLDAERDPTQKIAKPHDLRRETAICPRVVIVDVR